MPPEVLEVLDIVVFLSRVNLDYWTNSWEINKVNHCFFPFLQSKFFLFLGVIIKIFLECPVFSK